MSERDIPSKERLTDERISQMRFVYGDPCDNHFRPEIDAVLAEVQERRAAETTAEPTQYALEERCECGLTWRVHSGYAFDVKELFCTCGRKVTANRAAVKTEAKPK